MSTFTPSVRIECGDALELLRREPAESVDCIVTSPPYWGLRSYLPAGHPDKALEIGAEATPAEYVARMVEVFGEARRVLSRRGTLWLVLGDSFAGGGCGSRDPEKWPKQSRNDHMPVHAKRHAPLARKNLIGIPWGVAFALQEAGWILRADIVWSKTAPMPESVSDRPARAHEFVFLMARRARYHYDAAAIAEPRASGGHWRTSSHALHAPGQKPQAGIRRPKTADAPTTDSRNARDVWTLGPDPWPGAHFAVMPSALAERCILAGCPEGGTVLDPFGGSGTVGAVAARRGRNAVLFDLNPDYCEMARRRVYPEAQPRLALAAPEGDAP